MKVKLKKKDTTSVVSFFLVETKGIEPSTLRMRTVRSPRLSYAPGYEIQ